MSRDFTIAIVDDHTMFRKGLVALINLFPAYSVLFDTGSGEDCIRYLETGALPDILLMDIVMPGMEGYEATAWVRDHHPGVLVLALSTMEAESAIIGMIRSGARGYLLKDADPEELKKAFDEVVSLGYYYNDLVSRQTLQSARRYPEEKNPPATVTRLSDREIEFLKLICSEKTYLQVSREMFVSERTVDGYRDALFKKLGIGSRVGLVLYAIRSGIVKIRQG
jgi:DNA-binding NarL/FixJ family response regulator